MVCPRLAVVQISVGIQCHVNYDAYIYSILHHFAIWLSILVPLCYLSVPGPVMFVRGSSVSSTSVELSWTPPTDSNGNVTSYHIEYQDESKINFHGNKEINTTAPVSVTNYTVTGLEENTLYHFTVSAETSAGRGEGSTVSVRTSIDSESL